MAASRAVRGADATLRAMSATSEVPASFRSSAIQPGALGLVRDGIEEILSRRRLIGYLVRADLKKKGSDTLLGNVWWILDPLLQMAVYVVLVSIIFEQHDARLPALHLRGDPAVEMVHAARSVTRSSSVSAQERLIKQIQLPEDRAAGGGGRSAASRNFAFGLIPLAGLLIFFYPDRPQPVVVPRSRSSRLSSSCSRWPSRCSWRRSTCSIRDVGNVIRHVLRLWFYMSPALYCAGPDDSRSPRTSRLVELAAA